MFMVIQTGVSCKWINDSQRFLLEHFDTICDSPSQIYHFALPFSPPSSWLQKCYSMELPQAVKVVKGFPAEWGTCSRTVLLNNVPQTLSCWNNTIAIGLEYGDINILDAITGSQGAILSGHTDWVISLAFSPGGTSLVSGSYDETVRLWDMQTGGIVKTFYGHNVRVYSVSISSDCTRIASGSRDGTICLWDTQTGELKHMIKQQDSVKHLSFSPIGPGHLTSISGGKVQQWDINGHQTGPTYDGSYIAFSPDYTQFASWSGTTITVQNHDSREIVAKLSVVHDDDDDECCCFSPNGRFIAASAGKIIYVWDIASPDPHPVETFVGHSGVITFLVFSSSYLISASYDESVKFWQIGVLSTNPAATDPKSTPPASTPIDSISLQARDGIAISSDSAGVVKIWDILTGLCKASFQTPAKSWRDVQLIDGRLIVTWHKDKQIHIWDTEKDELLQTLDTPGCGGLRISGDGSKLFCLDNGILQAWEMWTWRLVGEVELEEDGLYLESFCPGGSKIWVQSEDLSTQGWDFGILDSPPVPLCTTFTERPHLDFIGGPSEMTKSPPWMTNSPPWIMNMVTGKKVFQLSGRYAKPYEVQWDGQYLAAGYDSGEVVILDFNHLGSQ